MMLDLLHSEEACLDHVLESQRDVKNLLDELRAEEVECALEVAVYDVGRNDKAQKHRKQLVCVDKLVRVLFIAIYK